MSKNKQNIILLERLLNQSRHDKLMYLNAADKQDLPTFKRFFNQQALYRNNMFNDFNQILSNNGINIEDVLLKRPLLRQLMMTTPKRERLNPFINCLKADEIFKNSLEELILIEPEEELITLYHKHLDKINLCIEANQLYSIEVTAKQFTATDLL
ncbi:MAG: hypothetical protein ACPHUE_01305 [Flavobacteriaceae bacterium]